VISVSDDDFFPKLAARVRCRTRQKVVHQTVEAEAGALYWPAWGRTLVEGFPFTHRVRHPADSPVNLLLDFAAALPVSLLCEHFDLSTAMPGWKCSCTLGKPP
jgi:hypothetical protein